MTWSFHVESPTESTKIVSTNKRIQQSCRIQINSQKLVAYLYINNDQFEKIKKTIPFTLASKRIKYLEINLTKEMKDLYIENYKTLLKNFQRKYK